MAEQIEIKVPDIGDFDAVEIIEIQVAVGDIIQAEDSLITLESDKAAMEIPASDGGKVTEILVNVGDAVGKDAPIVTVEIEEIRFLTMELETVTMEKKKMKKAISRWKKIYRQKS